MHLYKDDFIGKVKTKLIDTEIKLTEDLSKAYKITQLITLSTMMKWI